MAIPPIKGFINKIHSIVTQPGKIVGRGGGGGGGLKKTIYVNGLGVVKTLWTVDSGLILLV